MHTSLIIIDDFYQNPDKEREFALSLDFNVDGNYPGQRTYNVPLSSSVMSIISNAIKHTSGEVLDWHQGSTGSFQYCTGDMKSWIHSDGTGWAGVCYLTPDAPLSGGTGIFRHKETGIYSNPVFDPDRYPNNQYEDKKAMCDKLDHDGQDITKWELMDRVGNVYNRLVLYRQELYHQSLDYFGKTKEDARLFQTFFIKAEV